MGLQLYGTLTCPSTNEVREEFDWQRRVSIDYDVDADAFGRELTKGGAVPVLVGDGRVLQIGYRGRSCYVSPA